MTETPIPCEDTAYCRCPGCLADDLDVDLDAVVPCTTQYADCEQPAAWFSRTTCCGRHATLCDEHMGQKRARWQERELVPGLLSLTCGYCYVAPMPLPTWRPLTETTKETR